MQAGAVWEPGQHLWLVRLHHPGPVLRALWRLTDPLFRSAVDLDEYDRPSAPSLVVGCEA